MARSAEDIQADIDRFERLLKKRTGRVGFAANVQEIQTRLDAAKAELAAGDD
jgi:hypothetical protein